jgi:hypothetical protein
MLQVEKQKRTRVLDPIERVSEIIFGLIMALSFTGSVSAATAGREEIRTMMFAALGCNLAWGLVDGVMYLVSLRRRSGFMYSIPTTVPIDSRSYRSERSSNRGIRSTMFGIPTNRHAVRRINRSSRQASAFRARTHVK